MKAFLLDCAMTLLEGFPASETATQLKDTAEWLHSFSSSTPGLLVSATKKAQGALRDTLTKPRLACVILLGSDPSDKKAIR